MEVSETPSPQIDYVTTGRKVACKLCLLPKKMLFLSAFKFMSGAALLTVEGDSQHFHTAVMLSKGMSLSSALLLIHCNHELFNVFQNLRLQDPPEV